MNKLRKAIVIGVMSMTVLSLSVVAAPSAKAVAQAGDLIKMDGLSSVYYLAADGKRYVFPNEKTYFSWYSDFSSVVTIPQSELESYPLGKNVTMRPGTKLVKITTDPKVYAVEPNGHLVWVPSETVAKALWGDMWAKKVIDVPDAFFTNYTIKAGQVSETAYPTGSLVMFGSDATVYYIDADGKGRAIKDEASFLANRFKWDDIVKSSLTAPAAGSPIEGKEADLVDTSSGAGGQAGAGTGLTVALSGDTLGSVNVPSGASLVPFVTVNFTASNDGDVTIQNVTFTRKGTGLTTDFVGGYLYDGATRLTTRRSVNSSDNTVTFNAVNLKVPAGMTKTVVLRMDAATGDLTGNHYFQITSASHVVTNGAAVSGAFPVAGNTMAFSAVDAAAVTITGVTNDSNKKVGESNVIVGEFDIQNSSSNESVYVHQIRLRQEGTAGNDSVNGLSLELDGTIVASGLSMVDKYVNFTLDTPFEIKKSKTISAIVRGDIVTDINKTVQFYLSNSGDVDIRGSQYGDFYSVNLTNSYTTGTGGTITIKGSEINVSFDGPQAADVKADSTDIVFANFKIKAENEDVNIETMNVTITHETVGADEYLQNFELVDTGNNVAYSISSTLNGGGDDTATFENVLLEKGVQYTFKIQGDIQDTADPDDSYTVSINFASGFTARFQDSDETLVSLTDLSQSSLTGKKMTVKAPLYTLANVATTDNTVVKNASKVLLYKGKMTATDVDDLKMSKLTISGDIGWDDAQYFSTDFSRLYLYAVNADGTETLLDDETSLGTEEIAFSGFTWNIPKGLSNGKYFVVRGDVKSSPSGTTTQVKLINSASKYTVKDADNNAVSPASISTTAGHTTTVATLGTWTLAMDTTESGTNINTNALAGTVTLIGRVKVTAAKEAAILEDLVIQNAGTAQNNTVGKVYLYKEKEMTTKLGEADFAAGSNPKALLENVNVEIPATGVTYLYVAAMIKGIDYSATPGENSTGVATTTVDFKVPSDASGYTTKAIGKDTGETLANTGVDNGTTVDYTVIGARMSNIATDFANATLVSGTAKDIFSFKVTAQSSTNKDTDGTALGIKLGSVTFNVATSGAAKITGGYKIERVGGGNGEKSATVVSSGATSFALNFAASYSTDNDLIVRPGDTATYVVRANVSTDGTGDSLQVTLESVDTTVPYTHNTGVSGTDGNDTIPLYPKLSGITNVRGGTLSN